METTTHDLNENLNIKDSNQILDKEIQTSLVNGRLPCALAFKVARKLNITPGMVGNRANELKLRIINCQLGCFDVEKAAHNDIEGIHVAAKLREEIQTSLIDRYLSCDIAFQIAKKLKVGRRQVGDAVTRQKIKLSHCQLGCFP